jgi:CubicO group peptidase (beta-lactamase class C family)
MTVTIHILSGLLAKVSGMKTVDYANKYLFQPLGIPMHENYYAKSAAEHKEFTISKMPKGNIWFADPDGLGTPGYGLCMTAEDMAKIGLLCLEEGRMPECLAGQVDEQGQPLRGLAKPGQQIISSSWIHDMTVPRPTEGRAFRGLHYGYMWWIVHPEKNIYAAIGNSGNVIYIDPNKELVVSITSYFKPTVFDRIDFIEDDLLWRIL